VESFSADETYKTNKRGSNVFLRTPDFERMLRNIRRSYLFRPFFHITGGEPMLHPDFDDFVRLLAENSFRTAMTTNGFFLEKHAEVIVRHRVRQLNISLDGPAAIHDEIRGVSESYARAVAGIRRTIEEKRRLGTVFPKLLVNVVVHHRNIEALPGWIAGLDELGIDVIRIQHIMFTAEERNGSERIDVARLRQSMDEIAAARPRTPVEFTPAIRGADLERYYSGDASAFNTFCNIPWILFWILPNGDVSPCFNNAIVGNLVEEPLRRLWNNDRMKAFRQSLRKSRLFPYCLRCCFRQYY
jgi:radical SAM protein with 4Fe4S-binding SPASM domain